MEDFTAEDVDYRHFVNVVCMKTNGGKVPLLAVCHKYDRKELIEPWENTYDLVSRWFQMHNDIRDWKKDLSHRTATYFLSEALQRRRAGESVAEWVAREGFLWGLELLESWLSDAQGCHPGSCRLHNRDPVGRCQFSSGSE